MYDHVKTRAFLKVLLFNSFPLQDDKEMHNNLAKFYLCTFSVSRHKILVLPFLLFLLVIRVASDKAS